LRGFSVDKMSQFSSGVNRNWQDCLTPARPCYAPHAPTSGSACGDNRMRRRSCWHPVCLLIGKDSFAARCAHRVASSSTTPLIRARVRSRFFQRR
jgi:hypothetical protein